MFAWVASLPGAGPGDRPRSVHRCLERFLALARLDPAQYVRDVRTEVAKVTWPSRKETMITTMMVFVFVVLAAAFFFLVDQVMSLVVRTVLGLGA